MAGYFNVPEDTRLSFNGRAIQHHMYNLSDVLGDKPAQDMLLVMWNRENGGSCVGLEIGKAFRKALQHPIDGVCIGYGDNDMEWDVLFQGPEGTSYEGGIFQVSICFPSDYPSSPPNVHFKTPIFHPNVYPSGRLCFTSAGFQGSGYNADATIALILSIWCNPNLNSPANSEAAQCYLYNRTSFINKVKRMTSCQQ